MLLLLRLLLLVLLLLLAVDAESAGQCCFELESTRHRNVELAADRQTNVEGNLLTLSAILPTANTAPADAGAPDNAGTDPQPTVISVSAGSVSLDVKDRFVHLYSSYIAAKTALVRVVEHLASERPDLVAVSARPGVIPFKMLAAAAAAAGDAATIAGLEGPRKAGMIDTRSLAGDFFGWLSKEGGWLRGRMVWSNRDVEELGAEEGGDIGWGYVQV